MRATALSVSAFSCVADRRTEIATPSPMYVAPGDATGGSRTALPHLTRRQLEVLGLLCEGLPNKLICRALDISAGTVKAHISSILRELGVGSRLQAVVEARRRGLLGANGEGPRQLHSAGQARPAAPSLSALGHARRRTDPATGGRENNAKRRHAPVTDFAEYGKRSRSGEAEADAIVLFVALDTCKEQMLGIAVREELVVSYPGKPCDRNVHH